VLVFHDVLGLYDRLQPRFVREYANLRPTVVEAFTAFRKDVLARRFPAEEHTYRMNEAEEAKFQSLISGE